LVAASKEIRMLDSTATPPGLERLRVTHRDVEDGLSCVAVEGEVDLLSAPVLKGALLARVAAGATRIVLDLSGVVHMDSTGLGVLVGVRRRLPEEGLIAVAGAAPAVRSVFELTGLDRTFKLFDNVEAAMAELSAPAAPRPALSPDAALVLGLAATAVPFADSRTAEAERWLRALRLHGDAGRELSALGLGEAPLIEIAPTTDAESGPRGAEAVASVTQSATRLAAQRGAAMVSTGDLLAGVLVVYGSDFDRVLEAHGSDCGELIAHLDMNGWNLAGA
jgi:anti-sigma B factor antagonist